MNIHQDFNYTFDATAKVDKVDYELRNTNVDNLTKQIEKLILSYKQLNFNITNEELAIKVRAFVNSLFKTSNF